MSILRVDGFGNGRYFGPSNFLVVSFGFGVVSPGLVTEGVVFSGFVFPGTVGFVSAGVGSVVLKNDVGNVGSEVDSGGK